MANPKFKIGDKVKILSGSERGHTIAGYLHAMDKYCGDTAEIASFIYLRKFKVYYYRLKNIPYEWDESLLEAAHNENKIVITTDGTMTRAALYDGHKLIREAKAICSKEDTFKFEIGAKIAFERLTAKTAEPKQKKLNTKIFVVDGLDDIKSGHVYEIKDGKIIGDIWKYPIIGDLYNMDDVHRYFNGKCDTKYNSVGEPMGGFSTQKQVKVMEVKEDD